MSTELFEVRGMKFDFDVDEIESDLWFDGEGDLVTNDAAQAAVCKIVYQIGIDGSSNLWDNVYQKVSEHIIMKTG
jgi:hypothetical protein